MSSRTGANAWVRLVICAKIDRLVCASCVGPMDTTLRLCTRNRAPSLGVAGAVVSMLFLSGDYGTVVAEDAEPVATPVRSIAIFSLALDRIHGRFTEGNVGVTFDSSKGNANASLVIETLQGEQLLSVRQLDSGIAVAIDTGRLSIEVPNEDLVALRRARASGSLARLLQTPPSELRAPSLIVTYAQGSVEGLDNVRDAPEYALLPSLSWELGRLGITGQRFPPSLAIHAVGMAAAQALQIDPRAGGNASQQTLPPKTGAMNSCENPANTGKRVESAAQCKVSPDPEDECMGMCGRGCGDCWSWVCGDCCYHDICAIHDAASRACKKLSDLGLCVIAILVLCVVGLWVGTRMSEIDPLPSIVSVRF
jgi:hypothetical protein